MITKRIFSRDTAFELVEKGHNILRTEDNHKKKYLKVFVFIESKKLLDDLTAITVRNNLAKKNKTFNK